MVSNAQQLQLGDVTLHNFEVPEVIPNLFGVQKLAIHDFPSQGQGNRTVQQLGSFPFPQIEWHGCFFDNDSFISSEAAQASIQASAIQRASQLNTYRVQGMPIQLVWGPFQYQVMVAEFEIMAKLKQQLEYRIKLIPLQDTTTTSNTAPSAPNANQVALDANTGVSNATLTEIGALLPLVIINAAQLISANTTSSILLANNNVSNLSLSQQASLQAQIAALQTTLTPIINGTNYGQAAAASILSANLATLSVALGIGQAVPITTITVTNPNLLTLASQYYGDSSLWPLIAAANNLQDQFPIGTFTLVIPPESTQSALIPTS